MTILTHVHMQAISVKWSDKIAYVNDIGNFSSYIRVGVIELINDLKGLIKLCKV